MDSIWEKMHSERSWGKYPDIDLVKTVMREFKNENLEQLKVLELGCGAGANLTFFLREGFRVYGIDGSPSAIENANKNLSITKKIPHQKKMQTYTLNIGNFESLPYKDSDFDIVVDNLAIYANSSETIERAYQQAIRVLKTGGFIYSRVWGVNTTGSTTGHMLDSRTSESPLAGPCKDMGTSHFFDDIELLNHFCSCQSATIRKLTEEIPCNDTYTEEWVVWAKK